MKKIPNLETIDFENPRIIEIKKMNSSVVLTDERTFNCTCINYFDRCVCESEDGDPCPHYIDH